jgi:ABC-2 type transport system ATP-binding protein
MASALASPASTLPLKVDDLVKSFGTVKAVSRVSLELRAGECLGLLGPNGAGKSTVIRGIVGRVVPDAGSIAVFGNAASSAAAREALGWVPQELAVYPRLSCKENLMSFGRYHGLSGGKLAESVAWCLDWAALQDKAGELAKNLSGGMKRRLNMAAGIIHRPRVVLMDEPTVGVDPQSRNRIFEMIEALREGGTSIIYTTHYMEEAERLCDRILILDHGRVLDHGTPRELVQRHCPQRRITFATDAGVDLAPLADSAIEQAPAPGGGVIASWRPQDFDSALAQLMDLSRAGRLPVRDLQVASQSLEDVFIQLTGRGIRA